MKHPTEARPPRPGPQPPQRLRDTFRPASPRQYPVPFSRTAMPERGDLPLLAEPGGVCPACGAPPALRIAPRLAEHAGADDPDEPLATYRCQRRRCGCTYLLLAGHCRRAARESLSHP